MRTTSLHLAALALLLAAPALAGEPRSETLSVGVRQNMEATLYTPDGAGPFPSVLLMHTSIGVTQYDHEYCARLAREGFICIAPAYYRAYGITAATRRSAFTTDVHAIMGDFFQIIGMLNRLPKAIPGAAGAIGFSAGGYFAVMLAAERRVKAGVSYYGTLTGANAHPDLAPERQMFTSESAPVLILAGDHDDVIGTGPPMMLEEILKSRGARYELKMYPGATHDFERSFSAPGNQAAAADAWPRTLAFFREYLR